jgi:exopolysaccharide production protein ExoZ
LPPAPEKPKRIASIQVSRGLAALLVVLAHLHGIEAKYCTTNHLLLFEHGALGVDLFFVISGIVIAAVTARNFGNPRAAVTFLYHRLARIFPIYWIYTTLTLIARHYASLPTGGPLHILASYLLIPTHRPMLLLQGWTLTYELYFYLVFFLLLLLPKRLAPWLLTLWGIAVVALKLHLGLSPHPAIQVLISPSVLEFLAGCLLFHIYRRSRLHKSIGLLSLAAATLWLTAIIAVSLHTHAGLASWITDAPWLRPLLYGTFAILFLFAAIELERTAIIRFFPLLESIGDWSYSIDLCHVLVLELVARLFLHLLPTHPSIFLITLIGLPATLLAGYLSYTCLERPFITLFYQHTRSPQRTTAQPPIPLEK